MDLKNHFDELDKQAREEKVRSAETLSLMNKLQTLKTDVTKLDSRIANFETTIKSRMESIVKLKWNNAITENKRDRLQENIAKNERNIEVFKADFRKGQNAFFGLAEKCVKDMDVKMKVAVVEEDTVGVESNVDAVVRDVKELEGKIEAMECIVILQGRNIENIKKLANK